MRAWVWGAAAAAAMMAGGAAAQNCGEASGANWQGDIQIVTGPGEGLYGFELRRRDCDRNVWNYDLWNTQTGARWEGIATVGADREAGTAFVATGAPLEGCWLDGDWFPRDTINGHPYRARGVASCNGTGTFSATIQ